MNSMQNSNHFVHRWSRRAAAGGRGARGLLERRRADRRESGRRRLPPSPTTSGPASANADVQAFRINLWENIKANNRCGSCHGAGGQTPMFARNDDVNLAYQAANTVVNLTQPDQSRMVAKVAGGHNCWLASPSACGDTLTVWIRNWAGANATGGTQIQLQAPTIKEVGGSKSFPATPGGLRGVLSLCSSCATRRTANCVRCHSSSAATQQQPFFADRGRRRGLRGHQVEDQSRHPGAARASSSACATSSTTAGATRVARPTRRPCSTRSPRSPNAIPITKCRSGAAHLEGPDAVRRHGRGRRQPLRSGDDRQVRVQDRHGQHRL